MPPSLIVREFVENSLTGFTNLIKMENINQAIKIAKAIADKNRYHILKLIAQNKEICCMEILKKSHLSQPAVSHHLKVLLESKLASVRREGQYGYFSFNKKALKKYLRFLAEDYFK